MPLIQANGLTLNYDLSGPAGSPVVVLSHSLGTTLRMWDEVAHDLATRYRVLRYDTRGHGGSDLGLTDSVQPLDIDTLAEDLAGLVDALGLTRFHLVGLSLGGMTGQAFAANYPDRIATLSLLATSAFIPTAAQTYATRAAIVRDAGAV